MRDQRFITLLGSYALFTAFSLAILARPEEAWALYPFYGLILFWSDLRREAEASIIFVFLFTIIGLALGTKTSIPASIITIELVGLWLIAWGIAAARGRANADIAALQDTSAALEVEIKDVERDAAYYRAYEGDVAVQTRVRRDLADGARSLGSTLDPREVHARLIGIVSGRYPGARVTIEASAEHDPLLALAARRQGPILIKDASAEERVAMALRSGVAVPLRVMREAAGFLKIVSDTPKTFGPEDVKTADLLATMACLSLENIRLYEQIHQQATHDQLTQLHSHKAFQGRLNEEVLRAGRSQMPLSLIMCDVDHFKRYNDQYGHQAGDHLLRTLASILSSFARPVDFAARYGGEEFCLILPNFACAEAVELAERIRLRVQAEPFVFQGGNTNVTMSFGVAAYPQDATTSSQIIRVADTRLYRAKEQGRNQVIG